MPDPINLTALRVQAEEASRRGEAVLLGPATVLMLLDAYSGLIRENVGLQRQINEANASGFTPAAEAMIDGAVAEQVRFETALKHIGESDPRWHSYVTDVLENTAAPSTTEPAGPLEPMIETLRKLDPVEAARIEDWFKEFNARRGR